MSCKLHTASQSECYDCFCKLGHWPHQPTSEQLTKELVGLKHDNDKPDLSLLPSEFLEEVARAMMYGAKKYERYNYLNGIAWTRILAASLRHITAYNDGEDVDKESGVSHLGHAGACILMLLTYSKRGLGKDDRYKGKVKA